MRPLNSVLVCVELEQDIKTDTGFSLKTQNKFKKLEVVASNEEDVKEGSIVKVPITSGEYDGDFVIIRRSDIIYVI